MSGIQLEVEDILIVRFQSTPSKKEKVQNNRYDKESTKLKRHIKVILMWKIKAQAISKEYQSI